MDPGNPPAAAPVRPGDAAAESWLHQHPHGASSAEALAFFDARPAVGPTGLTGRWRGSGLPSGHSLDGLLEAYGWYGKDVVDAENVHPLLFRDRAGVPRPIDPQLAPVALLRNHPWLARNPVARVAFGRVRPLLQTHRPAARLRTVEHRGVLTGALVYDRLPVIDVFRRVSATVLVGMMDLRGLDQPFFFLLRREGAAA